MKKSILILTLIALAFSAIANDDVIILYDNDAHCTADGYACMASLKKEALEMTPYVKVVSSGDFLQGGPLGASSKGKYIVEIMNRVGYDFVTLGNHEFDYSMPVLEANSEALTAQVVDCNLIDLRSGERLFKPYEMAHCGDLDIAFIGISTPYSFASSVPSYFTDGDGNYIYSLSTDTFYETVQNMVDDARNQGADIVVALTHLGVDVISDPINSLTTIAATSGIDIVLDGHSHTTIECEYVENAIGEKVLLSQTGSHFERIGRLLIRQDGTFSTELIPVRELSADGYVKSLVDSIRMEYDKYSARHIGSCESLVRAKDEDGYWIVRKGCSGLGELCADAYRSVLNADVGCVGGGSLRSNIPEGEVTYNTLFSVFPFGNGSALARVPGSKILDMLEMSAMAVPMDFGGFLHVSNMTYDIDTSVESPVVLDDHKMFVRVEGPRRVRNVKILDRMTGRYEPLDENKIYSVASSDYLLHSQGDGYAMFDDAEVELMPLKDVEVLESFVKEHLGGVIPSEYSSDMGRIMIY